MTSYNIASNAPEGITPAVRTGTKFVCECPDEGAWSLTWFDGRLLANSLTSGLWELVDGKLEKVIP